MLTDEWHGCYKRGWGRELVPEAFAHPAKVSYSLAGRIYAHMANEGWIAEGMTVLDPFAGIGGFAYHALKHGLNFIGIELEPKFVDLAAQNIALWNRRYVGRFARWGTAQVIQGDSRRLVDVVCEAGATISSPPFSDMVQHDGGPALQQGGELHSDYGSTPGNLGNLRATDADFSAAVSSPPYADALSTGDDKAKRRERLERAGYDPAPFVSDGRIGGDGAAERRYGTTPGQLAAMRADGFDGAVSSPPFEDTQKVQDIDFFCEAQKKHRPNSGGTHPSSRGEYAPSKNNLGNSSGDSFWGAARAIVEQTFAVLRPGAHAVWILKQFVRNGALVDFPGQWRQLCEACGFVTLHEHHALLVRDDGTQLAMDGNHKSYRTEKKSFFRRLSEAKAQAQVFWPQISRADRARYLRDAHRAAWLDYRRRVLEPFESDLNPPVSVTRARIVSLAQVVAWVDAGKPFQEIKTRIDHETIYCMVKET